MGSKKGKMKGNAMRVKLLLVGWCILLVLLCAAPCGAAYVPAGTTSDIDETFGDYYLEVAGTANLLDGAVVGGVIVYSGGMVFIHPGAYVDWFIYAYGGSTVHVYGGQMGYSSFITVLGGSVTIYGADFRVDDVEWSAGEFIPASGYGSVLTGTYENLEAFSLKFYGSVPVYLVSSAPGLAIDIKPGSDTNVINLESNGVVPVAVLTTGSFEAATIDPATVRFAGAAPVHGALEDVDGDGDEDMLFHFRTQELQLDEGSVEATLTAQLADSLMSLSASNRATISGTDKVQILPSKSKKK